MQRSGLSLQFNKQAGFGCARSVLLCGRRRGDYDRRARLLDQTSVGMFLQGIEVDRISGGESEFFNTDRHLEFPLHEIQQLCTWMKMRCDFLLRQWMKVRQEAIQLPLICTEVQAFKGPRNGGRFGI